MTMLITKMLIETYEMELEWTCWDLFCTPGRKIIDEEDKKYDDNVENYNENGDENNNQNICKGVLGNVLV